MRVYICTDLEGISGVTHWDQTREMTTAAYQHARHLLTREVNACVQGCLEWNVAEPKQIVVMDGHGGGFNFVPDELHPEATYVTGPNRPTMLPGLDESFDAAILLGYHAMAGTPQAVLAHTQSSKAGCRYWYNGRESGEIAQSALVCGHFGVPVVMVTGDEAACAEAKAFLGEAVTTVAVKKGISITCCEMVAPQRAWELIRKAAAEALSRVAQCKPYTTGLPIHARLRYLTAEIADTAGCRLSKRVDATTYERTIESPLDIVRF